MALCKAQGASCRAQCSLGASFLKVGLECEYRFPFHYLLSSTRQCGIDGARRVRKAKIAFLGAYPRVPTGRQAFGSSIAAAFRWRVSWNAEYREWWGSVLWVVVSCHCHHSILELESFELFPKRGKNLFRITISRCILMMILTYISWNPKLKTKFN